MPTRSWHRFCSDNCRSAHHREIAERHDPVVEISHRRVVDQMRRALESLTKNDPGEVAGVD